MNLGYSWVLLIPSVVTKSQHPDKAGLPMGHPNADHHNSAQPQVGGGCTRMFLEYARDFVANLTREKADPFIRDTQADKGPPQDTSGHHRTSKISKILSLEASSLIDVFLHLNWDMEHRANPRD